MEWQQGRARPGALQCREQTAGRETGLREKIKKHTMKPDSRAWRAGRGWPALGAAASAETMLRRKADACEGGRDQKNGVVVRARVAAGAEGETMQRRTEGEEKRKKGGLRLQNV